MVEHTHLVPAGASLLCMLIMTEIAMYSAYALLILLQLGTVSLARALTA